MSLHEGGNGGLHILKLKWWHKFYCDDIF